MFPRAGSRILSSSIFSDNTQGNVSQRKKKEVISNLIKPTELQEKGFCPPFTRHSVPKLILLIFRLILVLLSLFSVLPSQTRTVLQMSSAKVHSLNPNTEAINSGKARTAKKINKAGKEQITCTAATLPCEYSEFKDRLDSSESCFLFLN